VNRPVARILAVGTIGKGHLASQWLLRWFLEGVHIQLFIRCSFRSLLTAPSAWLAPAESLLPSNRRHRSTVSSNAEQKIRGETVNLRARNWPSYNLGNQARSELWIFSQSALSIACCARLTFSSASRWNIFCPGLLANTRPSRPLWGAHIGVLRNGMNLLNVSSFWVQFVQRAVIFVAVLLDAVGQKQRR
jgi:hypothetical protein